MDGFVAPCGHIRSALLMCHFRVESRHCRRTSQQADKNRPSIRRAGHSVMSAYDPKWKFRGVRVMSKARANYLLVELSLTRKW